MLESLPRFLLLLNVEVDLEYIREQRRWGAPFWSRSNSFDGLILALFLCQFSSYTFSRDALVVWNKTTRWRRTWLNFCLQSIYMCLRLYKAPNVDIPSVLHKSRFHLCKSNTKIYELSKTLGIALNSRRCQWQINKTNPQQ